MKKLIILSALVTLMFGACKKDQLEPSIPNPSNTQVSKFKEVKTDPNFNWETTQKIQLEVIGLKTPATIINTLTVSSVDGKEKYFTQLHKMNENLSTAITLPAHVKEVMVNYGSIQKKYNTSAQILQFDFVMENAE